MSHTDKSENFKSDIKKPFSLREWLFSHDLDKRMFIYGLVFGLPGMALIFIYPSISEYIGPEKCMFLAATGFYCPGCGCTRAVHSIMHGHFVLSFLYNPAVLYGCLMWLLYEGSHILELLHAPHIKGMKFRYGYLYAGIAILLGNWIIKNIIMYIINY